MARKSKKSAISAPDIKSVDSEEKRPVGRPPKLVMSDALLEQLRALGGIHATVDEVAAVLRVGRRTLMDFFSNNEEARSEYEEGKLDGVASLRRHQFAMAEKNVAMAIWLGKQYLGQREPVQQIEQGGPGDFDHMTDEELREYVAEEAKALKIVLAPSSRGNGTRH